MALPATDTFTGANNVLSTYSANWAKCAAASGNMGVNTNTLVTSAASENGYRWTADSFNNDQYAQVVVSALTSNSILIGPAVRIATGTQNYYGVYASNNSTDFFKMAGGVWTQFGTSLGTMVVADILRIEVTGTSIQCKRNGANLGSAQTDSALASGSAGVTGFGSSTTHRMDNWEGGNLGTAAASLPPQPMMTPYLGLIGR